MSTKRSLLTWITKLVHLAYSPLELIEQKERLNLEMLVFVLVIGIVHSRKWTQIGGHRLLCQLNLRSRDELQHDRLIFLRILCCSWVHSKFHFQVAYTNFITNHTHSHFFHLILLIFSHADKTGVKGTLSGSKSTTWIFNHNLLIYRANPTKLTEVLKIHVVQWVLKFQPTVAHNGRTCEGKQKFKHPVKNTTYAWTHADFLRHRWAIEQYMISCELYLIVQRFRSIFSASLALLFR